MLRHSAEGPKGRVGNLHASSVQAHVRAAAADADAAPRAAPDPAAAGVAGWQPSLRPRRCGAKYLTRRAWGHAPFAQPQQPTLILPLSSPTLQQQQGPVAFVVEDAGISDPFYSHDTAWRAYRSAVFTLSLGVLGRCARLLGAADPRGQQRRTATCALRRSGDGVPRQAVSMAVGV